MLPTIALLRGQLEGTLACKAAQGHVTDGLAEELAGLPDDYTALAAFAERLRHLPLRDDWPYVEPNDLAGIRAECDPDRPRGLLRPIDPSDAAERARTAFLAAVAGCILGKPLEFNPTLADIRAAAEAEGDWPIRDYISEAMLERMGRSPDGHPGTTRGRITHVVPDDDINYTILGMWVLEEHGLDFTRDELMGLWLRNLPPLLTWGPERTVLTKAAMHSRGGRPDDPWDLWTGTLNPGCELCGATIRADAYGYACPGRPERAAELAWRDATMTHRRTGVYGAMFVAAAIATAFVARDRLEIFRTALRYVPRRSRFHEIAADCLGIVEAAGDCLEAYERMHARYGHYDHCKVYQEVGMLMNAGRFAADIGDGLCKAVSQGADTDCFGEIIGSILGAHLGPDALEPRWLEPFNDTLHTGLAQFHEQSLSAVAERMSRLPAWTSDLPAGA